MKSMDFQEGYVDGLAGGNFQVRPGDAQYEQGFDLGTLDRVEMLKNNS